MTGQLADLIRWIARLSALLVASLFVALALGEILIPHSDPPGSLREWTGIALFSVACLSVLLGWKWELQAALISLAALTAFALIVQTNRYEPLAIAAVPGLLFLTDWFMRHHPA